MTQNWIEIVDREGWQKKYPLEKNMIYIGSNYNNDVVLLNDQGVASRHIQLIASNDGQGYRLVNLADAPILFGSDNQSIPPRSVAMVTDGLTFRLGDFTIIFRKSGGGGQTATAGNQESCPIGLKFSLPYPQLAPHRSIEGVITIQNLGRQTGVKFKVELEGLEADCFDLEPGPLLPVGAEKDILVRLFHRGIKPTAGPVKITIHASAASAYPGHQTFVSQMIEVLPFYQCKLRVLPPRSIDYTQSLPPVETEPSPIRQSLVQPPAEISHKKQTPYEVNKTNKLETWGGFQEEEEADLTAEEEPTLNSSENYFGESKETATGFETPSYLDSSKSYSDKSEDVGQSQNLDYNTLYPGWDTVEDKSSQVSTTLEVPQKSETFLKDSAASLEGSKKGSGESKDVGQSQDLGYSDSYNVSAPPSDLDGDTVEDKSSEVSTTLEVPQKSETLPKDSAASLEGSKRGTGKSKDVAVSPKAPAKAFRFLKGLGQKSETEVGLESKPETKAETETEAVTLGPAVDAVEKISSESPPKRSRLPKKVGNKAEPGTYTEQVKTEFELANSSPTGSTTDKEKSTQSSGAAEQPATNPDSGSLYLVGWQAEAEEVNSSLETKVIKLKAAPLNQEAESDVLSDETMKLWAGSDEE